MNIERVFKDLARIIYDDFINLIRKKGNIFLRDDYLRDWWGKFAITTGPGGEELFLSEMAFYEKDNGRKSEVSVVEAVENLTMSFLQNGSVESLCREIQRLNIVKNRCRERNRRNGRNIRNFYVIKTLLVNVLLYKIIFFKEVFSIFRKKHDYIKPKIVEKGELLIIKEDPPCGRNEMALIYGFMEEYYDEILRQVLPGSMNIHFPRRNIHFIVKDMMTEVGFLLS